MSRFADWVSDGWEMLHGGAPIRFTLALVMAVGVLAFCLSAMDWSERFPHSTVAPKAAGSDTTTATLSPKPRIESIPGQPVGVPRTVPGLEAFAGYSPTLNSKLTEIVFACDAGDGEERNLDLFRASRDKPADTFRKPERLVVCSTSDTETDPTLSPDGLELIFVRSTQFGDCELWRAVRESPTSTFPDPELVEIPKLSAVEGVQFDSPQLIHNGGDLIVRVFRYTSRGSTSSYILAPRDSLEESFGPGESLPAYIEQARHFLTSDGLRAFVSRYHTIQLCCRPSHDAPFSAPGKLDVLNATRIGHAEGPVWVSPAEDFLFYCTTVADGSQTQRRYLWQVRIR